MASPGRGRRRDDDDDYDDPPPRRSGRFEYGNPGARFVAALIDGVLLYVVGFVMGLVIDAIFPPPPIVPGQMPTFGPGQFIALALGILIGWMYSAVLESGSSQATLGKMAMGLKVTDTSGNPIGFGQATGRHFAKIISSLICLIGYLMILFNDKRQGLHDQLAGTYVLAGKPGRPSSARDDDYDDDDDRGPPKRRGGDGITSPRDRVRE